ncbi:telomere length regulation protein TEL2 homolog [Bacillus rossius redtenbacheri]|uniref:telomere length regulation protein TEL2 homolog n=1 Tax=Bacillus rossius redtenbacheri TaxID=93214 RepID=UPI002FDCA3C1
MWKVRELADKVTNVVMNYTEIEAKVREATNDDAWGPTGVLMQEIAQSTFMYEHFPEVMTMLWKRMLQDNKKNWRRTYKSLLLLNYLVRNGSERVVTSAREHIYDLRSLENYTYVDEFGKDQGINVRHKVHDLIEFIQDDDKLREERKKAKKNKDKYVGMSSDAMGMRFGGGIGTWDEGPQFNKKDEYADWDPDNNWSNPKNKGKGFDETFNNSDDSEGEGGGGGGGGRQRPNEYKDQERDNDSVDSSEQRKGANPGGQSNHSTPSRPARPVKKIDLGAALHYGRGAEGQATPAAGGRTPVAPGPGDDDFDPRGSEGGAEFSDFSVAFQGPETNNGTVTTSEFADFSSAFSGASPASSNPQQSLFGSAAASSVIPGLPAVPFPIHAAPPPASLPPQPAGFSASPFANGSIPGSGLSAGSSNSNTDLFSDIVGGFAAPPTPSVTSPAAAFGGSAGLFGLLDSNLNSTACQETSPSVAELTALAKRLASSEECDVEALKRLLAAVVSALPGPFLPQKFTGQDLHNPRVHRFLTSHYSATASLVVRWFAHDWPSDLTELAERVLAVDGAGCTMFQEALSVLCESLKDCAGPSSKMDFIVSALEGVVKSDGIESAVLEQCGGGMVDPSWQQTVQMLVSLPDRVANSLVGGVPDVFTHDNFCKLLCVHVAKCFRFLSEASDFGLECSNVEPLSLLLSKVILIFGDHGRSAGLKQLVKILEAWTASGAPAEVVRRTFRMLSLTSVEPACVLVLQTCENPDSAKRLFGSVVEDLPAWKYAVCSKLTLMSYRDWRDPRLLRNLVGTLSGDLARELLGRMLAVWSDRSGLTHAPLEQHVYLTQAVILCLQSVAGTLTPAQRLEVEKKLFAGVPVHLESQLEVVRAIGMATAEIVTSLLHSEMDDDSRKFKFSHDKLSAKTTELLSSLKSLVATNPLEKVQKEQPGGSDDTSNAVGMAVDLDLSEGNIVGGGQGKEVSKYSSGDELLLMLREQCCRPLVDKKGSLGETAVRIVEPTERPSFESGKSRDDAEQLDSDDDEDEMAEETTQPPRYLRDLRDGLLDTEKPGRFRESLKVAEQLIASQLPGDDESLGLELLQILLSAPDAVYMPDFKERQFAAAVAVVCAFPPHCAEYLAAEFSKGSRSYTVSQMLLMLDVLTSAARSLAGRDSPRKGGEASREDEGSTTTRKKRTPEELLLEESKKTVQDRIESHTRRFGSARKRQQHVEFVNRFAPVAGSFLFPLLRGFARLRTDYRDVGCLLLVAVLRAAAAMLACAANGPVAARLARELLEFCRGCRGSAEAEVREAAAVCVGAVALSVPRSALSPELWGQLAEARAWLASTAGPLEPHEGCRSVSAAVLALLDHRVFSL